MSAEQSNSIHGFYTVLLRLSLVPMGYFDNKMAQSNASDWGKYL